MRDENALDGVPPLKPRQWVGLMGAEPRILSGHPIMMPEVLPPAYPLIGTSGRLTGGPGRTERDGRAHTERDRRQIRTARDQHEAVREGRERIAGWRHSRPLIA